MAPPRVKSQTVSPSKSFKKTSFFKNKPKGGKGKSLSRRAISEISDAARFAESIGSDKKFSDLAKQYKQYDVKYPDRPPAFRASYGDEVNKVGTPLASTYYKDPVTGEERFFTAQTPTFKQLAGDIGRGLFSGYNTLSYDPNAGGIPTTTGGQIVRQQGLFPLLADKAMSGQLGIMGIAKGLYEQFTNSAAKAKDALVKGVNKLSDIDLEVLKKKGTGEYKFLSKKPEIQEIDALEQEEKGAIGLANEAGKTLDLAPLNATQRATYDMLTSKVNPLTHEQALNQVQSQFIDNRPLQEKLQDISTASNASFNNMNNLTESGQMIYDRMKNLNMNPERINERMQEINQGNLSKGILGPLFAAEGGSVDKKLNDLQKKTNNIYGTGILSVR